MSIEITHLFRTHLKSSAIRPQEQIFTHNNSVVGNRNFMIVKRVKDMWMFVAQRASKDKATGEKLGVAIPELATLDFKMQLENPNTRNSFRFVVNGTVVPDDMLSSTEPFAVRLWRQTVSVAEISCALSQTISDLIHNWNEKYAGTYKVVMRLPDTRPLTDKGFLSVICHDDLVALCAITKIPVDTLLWQFRPDIVLGPGISQSELVQKKQRPVYLHTTRISTPDTMLFTTKARKPLITRCPMININQQGGGVLERPVGGMLPLQGLSVIQDRPVTDVEFGVYMETKAKSSQLRTGEKLTIVQ